MNTDSVVHLKLNGAWNNEISHENFETNLLFWNIKQNSNAKDEELWWMLINKIDPKEVKN